MGAFRTRSVCNFTCVCVVVGIVMLQALRMLLLPIALNSGTGMLLCSRYRFWPVPVWPGETTTDKV